MLTTVNQSALNLQTIMDSGQCFRIFPAGFAMDTSMFDIVSGSHFIRAFFNPETNEYNFNCSNDEWNYWKNYFDLDTDYSLFYNAIEKSNDNFLKQAANYGKGMRILKQDFWETVISFIISQNNNIPRIKNSIEAFCKKFGEPIEKYGIVRYSFPSKDSLRKITYNDLSDLGLGYRQQYLYEAIKGDPAPFVPEYDKLITAYGIGSKVASCILLYGAHDLTQFPMDTWMKKLVNDIYNGNFDTTHYQGFQGFIQQLQFYYYRHLKGKDERK